MTLQRCFKRISALQYSSAAATTQSTAAAAAGTKQQADVPPSEQRLLTVAVIGLPNAGGLSGQLAVLFSLSATCCWQ
jgi:hypothetical protein